MKIGDKVMFVKHMSGYKKTNKILGLHIGDVYEVVGISKFDGSPYVNTDLLDSVCVFLDEVELVKNTKDEA